MLNFHETIDMHSKYDNIHKNRIFYALICITLVYIMAFYDCMLSRITHPRMGDKICNLHL